MPNCITDSQTCQLVNQCKQRFFNVKNLYILALPTYKTHSILEPIFMFKSVTYTRVYTVSVKLGWRLSCFGMKADEQACSKLGYSAYC